MFIAVARVELIIAHARSLKDKRQVIKSLTTRVRNQFNVSVSEVDMMDMWQRGILGVACVSNSPIHARKQLDRVLHYIEMDGRCEVGLVETEML